MYSDESILELHRELAGLPEPMINFSRSLRSLYAEHDVSSGDATSDKFIIIRDKMRYNVDMYTEKVLPLARAVVINIGEYFDNYLTTDIDDWSTALDDIIEEVRGHQKNSEKLKKIHVRIMDLLQVLYREASEALGDIKQDLSNLDKQKEKAWADDSVRNHYLKAPSTSYHPGASGNISQHFSKTEGSSSYQLGASGNSSSHSSGTPGSNSYPVEVAGGRKSGCKSSVTSAAQTTERILIPAAASFLDGLLVCQNFFRKTEEKLTALKCKLRNTPADQKEMQNHFEFTKKEAAAIDKLCKGFLIAVGEVGKGKDVHRCFFEKKICIYIAF
jgi:hypothetical protein